MSRLGFIGLGTMGGNMVSRFLDKGHTVTGYNRTREKAEWLLDRGMVWADSPRAVAAASEVTFNNGHQRRGPRGHHRRTEGFGCRIGRG